MKVSLVLGSKDDHALVVQGGHQLVRSGALLCRKLLLLKGFLLMSEICHQIIVERVVSGLLARHWRSVGNRPKVDTLLIFDSGSTHEVSARLIRGLGESTDETSCLVLDRVEASRPTGILQ